MPENLVLLGDSVIDNAVYIRPGEPDVTAQVASALPAWKVARRAVDGAVATDVIAHQLAKPLPQGAAAFLSVGGNDALSCVDLLVDPTATTFAAAMERLGAVRDMFAQRYAQVADAVASAADGPVMAATIYNPAFVGADASLQAPAEGALSAFNDVIQRHARRCGFQLLELRALFDSPSDYANPIEPSAAGGAKIARAVADWLDERPPPPERLGGRPRPRYREPCRSCPKSRPSAGALRR